MEFGSADHRKLRETTTRELLWTSRGTFQGWTCTQCEWNYPVPELLTDADAKTAFDRLAASKFKDHKCSDHAARLVPAIDEGFTSKIRQLISQGFKPKDAVELMLQEVALEYRGQAKVLEQAKAEGEDFLRRMRAGVI
ncbi:MAG TPA: hypothetical protein VMP68_18445 [Candidatus Eisenbacteria bacterium]|nr:hypothetical protein [Candidatus Eisenbacteria bacterium]